MNAPAPMISDAARQRAAEIGAVEGHSPADLSCQKTSAQRAVGDKANAEFLERQAPGLGNHFRLFEVWANEAAFNAHNLAAHTQTFRNALYPMLGTPYDQRKYQRVN